MAADTQPVDSTRTARRVGGVTVDQVISSSSNLLTVIWAAHLLQPADFGRFSILLMVCTMALGIVHALVSVPAVAHPDEVDERPWRVLGCAFALAVGVAAPLLAIAVLLIAVGSSIGQPALALGCLIPLLLLHDVGRYVGFSRATPGKAIALDVIWLSLLVAGLGTCWYQEWDGLLSVTLVWAGAGGLAALWLLAQYGWPTERPSLRWVRSHWSFSWRSLVGNVTATGGALVGSVAVVFVSNPLSVAAIRASMLLRRPGQMLQSSVSTAVANDVAREQPDRSGLRRYQRRAMLLATAAGVVNLAVLVFLPDAVGRAVLGGVWDLIEPLRLPVGLFVLVLATQAGMRAVLLGCRQISTIMKAEIVGTIVIMAALIIGAAVDDAAGALWAVVIGSVAVSLMWRVLFDRYLRTVSDSAGSDASVE